MKHLFFVSNGTIALQLAIRALGVKKEIITTPFSYVASTSSIVWEGCRPKFVDINPRTLCIDEKRIERAITKDTQAILAVHVYGNPCEVTAIESIAKKHRLKVIYDAAHAFGVKYKGKSILNYGDISTISFHATKVFHTVEGGAVITGDDGLAHRLSYMRDFGHDGTERFFGLGVNGKNTELHAAMGLCVLPKVGIFLRRRKTISDMYSRMFKKSSLKIPDRNPEGTFKLRIFPRDLSLGGSDAAGTGVSGETGNLSAPVFLSVIERTQLRTAGPSSRLGGYCQTSSLPSIVSGSETQ